MVERSRTNDRYDPDPATALDPDPQEPGPAA
jgi:hypothetical protein